MLDLLLVAFWLTLFIDFHFLRNILSTGVMMPRENNLIGLYGEHFL